MPEHSIQQTLDFTPPPMIVADEFVNDKNVEKHAKAIIDHLVVSAGEKAEIKIDLKIEAFSSLMQQMKQN